jgi:alginate O-acetyltransferase complex protein AlgJ
LVFDPAPILAEARSCSGKAQFLKTDTHWTPQAMDIVARRLAAFLTQHAGLPPGSSNYRRVARTVSNHGDIAVMLRLPESQALFPPEEVQVQQVFDRRTRLLWRPQTAARVLVLGDSFSNVYSLDAMGWGHSAGLTEQLSYHLKRPVDRILRNDAGAYATRRTLNRELAAGRDRLEGKRVVVWEFAARELVIGDWKPFRMQAGQPRPTTFFVPGKGEELVVTGTVNAVSSVPRPGTVPYIHHILQVHLIDLEDDSGRLPADKDILAYMWSMRNNRLTDAARYRAGRPVRLRVRAWAGAPQKRYGSINRSSLTEDEIEDIDFIDPCWAEPFVR